MPRPLKRGPRFDYQAVCDHIRRRLAKGELRSNELITDTYPYHVIRRALVKLKGEVVGSRSGYHLNPRFGGSQAIVMAAKAEKSQAVVEIDQIAKALDIAINKRERSISFSAEGMRITLRFEG